ncbi:MAG: hypothetical protein V1921_06580 [Candidatus Altiarchaeota archaeon]
MTGTKVIKLKLDESADKLPKLREKSDDRALKLFDEVKYHGNPSEFYDKIFGLSEGWDVDSQRLQQIYDSLSHAYGGELDTEKAGLFLSALMQTSSCNTLTLEVYHPLDRLCGNLFGEKDIRLVGNVGERLAEYMTSGKITVEGDAGSSPGLSMIGGKLHIKGDAGEMAGNKLGSWWHPVVINGKKIDMEYPQPPVIMVDGDTGDKTGFMMYRGLVHVKGNAGAETGALMKGGIITVAGRIKSISPSFEKDEIWEAGVKRRPIG